MVKKYLSIVLTVLLLSGCGLYHKYHRSQWEQLNHQRDLACQTHNSSKAIKYAKEAYAYAGAHFGEEHPNTLASLHNLAHVYQTRQRYREAEALYKKCLRLSEKALGRDHPDTLLSVQNLTVLYESQGRYDEAKTLNQASGSSKISSPTNGILPDNAENLKRYHEYQHNQKEKDLDMVVSIRNQASMAMFQGRDNEAETLYKRALELAEEISGKDHPETLLSMNSLAIFCQTQGRYDEAEALYKKIVDLSKKTFGQDHPDTRTAMNNLAALYQSQGRHKEGKALYNGELKTSAD
ncbi:MAG: tetratricopeptide repeat protein, partial [Desulfobacteraceae bacterium]